MKITMFSSPWIVEEELSGEKGDVKVAFRVKEELFSKKTPYQKIRIVENGELGRVLFLDGFLQVTTVGEAVYHEMLVHPALMSHPKPERVLIIGGGDGGTLREVLKHPVKEAVMVEIDEEVIEASKKYLPSVSRGAFQDPRVSLVIEDGADFVKKHQSEFDCIILDGSDADKDSPAAILFEKTFLKDAKRALKSAGILSVQAGYFHEEFGKKMQKTVSSLFANMTTFRAFVRDFPTDEHRFLIASDKVNAGQIPLNTLKKRFKLRSLKTQYYSPEMHEASSVIPSLLA